MKILVCGIKNMYPLMYFHIYSSYNIIKNVVDKGSK